MYKPDRSGSFQQTSWQTTPSADSDRDLGKSTQRAGAVWRGGLDDPPAPHAAPRIRSFDRDVPQYRDPFPIAFDPYTGGYPTPLSYLHRVRGAVGDNRTAAAVRQRLPRVTFRWRRGVKDPGRGPLTSGPLSPVHPTTSSSIPARSGSAGRPAQFSGLAHPECRYCIHGRCRSRNSHELRKGIELSRKSAGRNSKGIQKFVGG